mgnify:CR=1 FL=1
MDKFYRLLKECCTLDCAFFIKLFSKIRASTSEPVTMYSKWSILLPFALPSKNG